MRTLFHHPNFTTYCKLILTAFLWGGTWIAGRVVVQEVAPFAAAFLRFFIAVATTLCLVYFQEGRLPRPNKSEWIYIVAMGLIGIFLYNIFFLNGLKYISAGRGALVVALNPAVIALVAWWVFGEAMNPRKGIGIALALFGCVFVITNGRPSALFFGDVGKGEWLIVGCVLAWTLYTFIARRATRTLSALVANLYAYAIGCAMLGVASWVSEPDALHLTDYSWKAWLCIFYLGFFGNTISYAWFIDGVKKIGAARAAAFINLVPIAGVGLGVLLLGERLHVAVLFGGALTILGVYITNAASRFGPWRKAS